MAVRRHRWVLRLAITENNGLVDFYKHYLFLDDYNPLYRNDGNAKLH